MRHVDIVMRLGEGCRKFSGIIASINGLFKNNSGELLLGLSRRKKRQLQVLINVVFV